SASERDRLSVFGQSRRTTAATARRPPRQQTVALRDFGPFCVRLPVVRSSTRFPLRCRWLRAEAARVECEWSRLRSEPQADARMPVAVRIAHRRENGASPLTTSISPLSLTASGEARIAKSLPVG